MEDYRLEDGFWRDWSGWVFGLRFGVWGGGWREMGKGRMVRDGTLMGGMLIGLRLAMRKSRGWGDEDCC